MLALGPCLFCVVLLLESLFSSQAGFMLMRKKPALASPQGCHLHMSSSLQVAILALQILVFVLFCCCFFFDYTHKSEISFEI